MNIARRLRLLGKILVGVAAYTAPVSVAVAWETTLHKFADGTKLRNGVQPQETMVADANGTLFGTTYQGGERIADKCYRLVLVGGCGTVFMLKPPLLGIPVGAKAKPIVIHRFNALADGVLPMGVTPDGEGGLYGLTFFGGTVNADCRSGCGTVFRLRPPADGGTTWTHTTLYRFKGGRDAQYPHRGLTMDKDGALYGVSASGGGFNNCFGFPSSCGIAFQLTPVNAAKTVWRETVLHRFSKGSDGGKPAGGLAIDRQTGALYGVTAQGSQLGCGFLGCGTVYRLTPPAGQGRRWTFTTLHTFTGGVDGNGSGNALVFADGVLYGSSSDDGGGLGSIFHLSPPANNAGRAWRLTVLHAFDSFRDGGFPLSVALAPDGTLYGTTLAGNTSAYCTSKGCGVVYKLVPPAAGSKAWRYHVLHRFNGNDGLWPIGGVTLVGNHVYGATLYGGPAGCRGDGCGVLFDVSR